MILRRVILPVIGVFAAATVFVGGYSLIVSNFCDTPLGCVQSLFSGVPTSQLVGTWSRDLNASTGTLRSYRMTFAIEQGAHLFSSQVNHQPEYTNCAWSLKGSVITIDCPQDGIQATFQIQSLTASSLVIVANGDTQSYTRVIDGQ